MTVRTWCDACLMYHAPGFGKLLCSNNEDFVSMTQPIKGQITLERETNMVNHAMAVVATLKIKNPKYGDSWKSRGGYSAFNNLDRKWSRVENLASQHHWDIFAAIEATRGEPDGMLETLKDLIGYGLLILDETEKLSQSRYRTAGDEMARTPPMPVTDKPL